ncbi:MAG: hypothetical protein IT405_00915 [Candidatus Yanofskybacteria bacterium]|nr:hypothetical protein [Candidatus Yanofskybacteria bacterium]
MASRGGAFLCKLGWHDFEKEPSRKELIRDDGVDFAFWTRGVQKGIQRCTRAGCNAERKVYRTGWMGIGGTSGPWKRLGVRRERRIDALPTL